MKILAIIPARGGSKRIPRKNIKNFVGRPIIKYSISAAKEAGCFNEIMVSTDDPEIARMAESCGARVPFFRSKKNSDNRAMIIPVLAEVLMEYKKRGKKFEYVKNNFYYRDIYFGFNPFIGEEIVFFRKKPIWGMNYYSEIIAGHVSAMIIYAFLKKALKKVPKNKPFRGPDNFNDKNFEYINTVKGTIKKCIGKEKIFYNKKLVYILNYCGGIIKEKN